MDKIQEKIDKLPKGTYICTVCGHLGKPKNNTKGSFLIELALWCFFIVPGLIYSLWRVTNKYSGCSQCGNTAVIPVDTPNGRAIFKNLHSE